MRLFTVAALTVGVTLRIWHYVAQRSFWIDEARLALNIGSRDYIGLLRPLDYDQAAPPLFLWAEKFLTVMLGLSELSLRLLPLLAGLSLLVMLVPLARQVLSERETSIVVLIVAVLPILVHYSNELKPYAVDAAISTGLALLALRTIRRSAKGGLRLLTVVGSVAVWASAPAVFMLCGIGAALGTQRQASSRDGRRAAVVGLIWLLSFAAAYLLVYGPSSANEYLQEFWEYRMLEPIRPEWSQRFWAALNEVLAGLISKTSREEQFSKLSIVLTSSILLLIILGARRMFREGRTVPAWIIVGPLIAVVFASVAGLYPLALRLILFAAPFIVILTVAGAGVALTMVGTRLKPFLVGGMVAGFAYQPYQTCMGALAPTPWDHTHSLILNLTEQAKRSETIYIEAGALPAWIYYTTNWEMPDMVRLALAARIGSSGGMGFENAPSRKTSVLNEGDSLSYDGPAWREIYGIFTGSQWRWGLGLSQQRPDSGWAANEVRRIVQASDSIFWTLFVYDHGASAILRGQLERGGAFPAYEQTRGAVQLVKYSRHALSPRLRH